MFFTGFSIALTLVEEKPCRTESGKTSVVAPKARVSLSDPDPGSGRVGGLNVPMPYARVLELECIPDVDDVVAAVRKLG